MPDESQTGDAIIFLGTAGARFMITTQILASGGLWFNLAGTEILLDPGPGCIVQSTKRKLRAERLSAIILSHRHLDHSADTNIMVEAMTQGGLKQNGLLFAPADSLETEPVIFSFLKDRLEGVGILQEGNSYSIGNISFTTPVRHIHSVETYGMIFRTPKHTFSYISDTLYFDDLSKHYGGDLLIMNIAFVAPRPPSKPSPNLPVEHLSVPDAEHLIRKIKPKVAILTHFGMGMWRAKPWEIADRLSQETGVKVIAARDGMKFELSQLEN
ncbi:MBL fold metallo-hydrolase [Chloroflexota bacterium]